jgi:hypothetical protein
MSVLVAPRQEKALQENTETPKPPTVLPRVHAELPPPPTKRLAHAAHNMGLVPIDQGAAYRMYKKNYLDMIQEREFQCRYVGQFLGGSALFVAAIGLIWVGIFFWKISIVLSILTFALVCLCGLLGLCQFRLPRIGRLSTIRHQACWRRVSYDTFKMTMSRNDIEIPAEVSDGIAELQLRVPEVKIFGEYCFHDPFIHAELHSKRGRVKEHLILWCFDEQGFK